MDLDSLPNEMLQHIFSYLDPNDLCQLTGQVCGTWQVLSYHTSLWKTNKLDGSKQSPNEILRIVHNSLLARRFIFSDICEWTFMPALLNCNYLRKIQFNTCNLTVPCVSKLVNALPRIDSVHLETQSLLNLDIIREIVRWEFLETITINVYARVILNGNNCLSLMEGKCKHLESLNLGYSLCVNDSSMLNFVQSHGAMLKALKMNMKDLSVQGFQFLTYCPKLTDLYIYMPHNMKDNAIMLLKELRFLEKLVISTPFTDSTKHYTDLFKSCTFINLFDLTITSCTHFGDGALQLISINCPSLKKLILIDCSKVSDKGIRHIVDNSRNLENLTLSCLRITGSCFAEIFKLTKLVHLELEYCARVKREIKVKLKSQNSKFHLHLE